MNIEFEIYDGTILVGLNVHINPSEGIPFTYEVKSMEAFVPAFDKHIDIFGYYLRHKSDSLMIHTNRLIEKEIEGYIAFQSAAHDTWEGKEENF